MWSGAEKSADTEVDFPAHLVQFSHLQLLDIAFHFEDSPSETLQMETSRASQVLLCFCVPGLDY